MFDISNRRRDTRYAVTAFSVKVHDKPSGQFIGTAANISASGLMMIGDRKASLGGVAALQLRWTRGQEESHLNFAATTLWQTPAADGQTYWSGHQITDISLDDHAELLMLAEAGEAID